MDRTKLQNITPRFQRRYFPEDKRRNQLTTIVTYEEGQAHCWINQNAKLSLGCFDAGQEIDYTFNPLNKSVFVFNISGKQLIAENELSPRDAIGIWETAQVNIRCATESRFIIIETPVNH